MAKVKDVFAFPDKVLGTLSGISEDGILPKTSLRKQIVFTHISSADIAGQ